MNGQFNKTEETEILRRWDWKEESGGTGRSRKRINQSSNNFYYYLCVPGLLIIRPVVCHIASLISLIFSTAETLKLIVHFVTVTNIRRKTLQLIIQLQISVRKWCTLRAENIQQYISLISYVYCRRFSVNLHTGKCWSLELLRYRMLHIKRAVELLFNRRHRFGINFCLTQSGLCWKYGHF